MSEPIPTRLEVLETRVMVALRTSQSFPVKVDLSYIPDHIREQVLEELEDKDYGVWWNGDHEDIPKAVRLFQAMRMPALVSDYWLIYPCPVEQA